MTRAIVLALTLGLFATAANAQIAIDPVARGLALKAPKPGGSNTQVQYNNSGSLAGSPNLTFNGTDLSVGGALQLKGSITFATDNAYSIGAPNSARPQNVYVTGNYQVGQTGEVYWAGRAQLSAPGDGLLQIQNNSGNGGQQTVASLPTCTTALRGTRGMVTDADQAFSSANFGVTPTHTSGSNSVPVICDGGAWRIGG